MQVVRLVKTSDLQQVSELIKKTGIGMTTMPKNRKEVQERIAWSVNSANKKSANPNKDTYLFVLENEKKIIGISAIYTSVSKEKPSVFFKLKKIKLSSDTYKFEKTSDILQLHLLHKPYSELGTIFIDPSSRGRGRGSLLSFARLQLIAADKSRFDKKILVDIRGWKDKNNKSYFWESFKIPIVKSSFKVKVEVKRSLNFSNYGFITNYSLNNFRVVRENYNLIKNNTIEISQKTAKALQISTGDKVRINIESI